MRYIRLLWELNFLINLVLFWDDSAINMMFFLKKSLDNTYHFWLSVYVVHCLRLYLYVILGILAGVDKSPSIASDNASLTSVTGESIFVKSIFTFF